MGKLAGIGVLVLSLIGSYNKDLEHNLSLALLGPIISSDEGTDSVSYGDNTFCIYFEFKDNSNTLRYFICDLDGDNDIDIVEDLNGFNCRNGVYVRKAAYPLIDSKNNCGDPPLGWDFYQDKFFSEYSESCPVRDGQVKKNGQIIISCT